MLNSPKYILLHCSDVSYTKIFDQFQSINNYHKERGFPISSLNYFIGYHRLITGDKNYQCRLDVDEGSHCNQKVNGVSMNFQSLSVCVGFDGDIEYPTAMQYALLQKQIWAWQDTWKIPNENVTFHRDYYAFKTCPGMLITPEWLATLLKRPMTTSIPPKPIESMCISEKAEITELKRQLSWYDKLLSWFIK